MEDLRKVAAANLIELRKKHKITQLELAEKLNYSDKAVSKWERGESLPDVAVLKQIADIFGVSVDWLLEEEHKKELEKKIIDAKTKKNRRIITLLATALIWLVATVVAVNLSIYSANFGRLWLIFVYAVPLSCIILLVFNSIWGKGSRNFIIISALVWTSLATICLSFSETKVWLAMCIGIPAQLIIVLWSRLKLK